MVVTAMASDSSEASATSLPSSMMLLRCNQGSELNPPFMDKTILKGKVQAKLSQLSPEIGRHLTLKKVHLKENNWSLMLFFEPIEDEVRDDVLELMKDWVGPKGTVKFLSDQETATQTLRDVQFRGEKRSAQS